MSSSKYSGVIQLNDLNDFIGPGLECIKPIGDLKASRVENARAGELTVKKVEKAKISLSDCLACNGCVTSAETVLINQQSIDELIRVVDENNNDASSTSQMPTSKKIVCFSVSPQAQASLAVRYGMELERLARHLCAFLKKRFGAAYVFDTAFSREFSIIESQKEFVRRFRENAASTSRSSLPVLTSICPGWICYAEKTHGALILPHLSSVKSPQQVMGSLLKDHVCRQLGSLSPKRIYHVSIMPCYDKKLEASRSEFYDGEHESRDVDCVLSTGELDEFIAKEAIDLNAFEGQQFDLPFVLKKSKKEEGGDETPAPLLAKQPGLFNASGGGSGGYAENVLVYAAKELFGHTLRPEDIQCKAIKNNDYVEMSLLIDGECKLKFAKAYGFRNIQSVVQKIKKRTCAYQFVEIMACPLGCLSGGGQIRANQEALTGKQLFERVEQAYNSVSVAHSAVSLETATRSKANVADLYKDAWLHDDEAAVRRHLHTSFNAVEASINNLTIKW